VIRCYFAGDSLLIALAICHHLHWQLAMSTGILLVKVLVKALAKVLVYCCQQH
jgi:hypothetical protein